MINIKKELIKYKVLGFFIPFIELLLYILIILAFNRQLDFFLVLSLLITLVLSIIFVFLKNKKYKSISIGALISYLLFILFYFIGWPIIQRAIVQKRCNEYGPGYKAVRNKTTNYGMATQAIYTPWLCINDEGKTIIPERYDNQ